MRQLLFTLVLLGSNCYSQALPPTVFGLQIGAANNLPICGPAGAYEKTATGPCFERRKRLGESETVTSGRVRFKLNEVPFWVVGTEVHVLLVDDKIERVEAYTRGYTIQDIVLGDMREKFGEPTVSLPMPGTTPAGKLEIRTALWSLPAISVSFFGALGRLDSGLVTIESPTGRNANKAREQAEKAQFKPM